MEICELCNNYAKEGVEKGLCLACEIDLDEEIDYEPEEICQYPNCHKELIEVWELEQGLCEGHIHEADLREIEETHHPDCPKGKA